ncbi:hypothetical protein J2X61_006469 [Bacillus sp. 3255]|nr:hypothetical protein [Bacillus sp. 3255]
MITNQIRLGIGKIKHLQNKRYTWYIINPVARQEIVT